MNLRSAIFSWLQKNIANKLVYSDQLHCWSLLVSLLVGRTTLNIGPVKMCHFLKNQFTIRSASLFLFFIFFFCVVSKKNVEKNSAANNMPDRGGRCVELDLFDQWKQCVYVFCNLLVKENLSVKKSTFSWNHSHGNTGPFKSDWRLRTVSSKRKWNKKLLWWALGLSFTWLNSAS